MTTRRLPDLIIERMALGELPAGREAELRARAERDDGVQARLDAVARSNAEILAELPAAQVASEIARRRRAVIREPAPARRGWTRFVAAATGVACAAALGLWVARDDIGVRERALGVSGRGGDDITRPKGAAQLVLHRKRGDHIVRLDRGGAAAREGDLIQVFYLAGGAAHGVVVSIDGAGVATLHFPDAEHAPTRLASPTRAGALSHAYELDDAPMFERFFFVTSDRPIDAAAVMDSARRLAREPARARQGALQLSPGLEQWSVLIRKEITP